MTANRQSASVAWCADDIQVTTAEFDLSSWGQSRRRDTTVLASGVRLVDAIEWVDVDPDATQVSACEYCGCAGCAPGGWVALRRIGDRVIWVPSFGAMGRGAWELDDYGPPPFLRSRGAPLFGPAAWERLRALNRRFPHRDDLPRLDSREAARLCQWTAPCGVLGEFPGEPSLRRDWLLAVTDGELRIEADVVDDWLRTCFRAAEPMEFCGDAGKSRPIEFWLEDSVGAGWTSFAHVPDGVCMLLGGGTARPRGAAPHP